MTQEDYKGIARELFKMLKPMLKNELGGHIPKDNSTMLDPNEELLDRKGLAELLGISLRQVTRNAEQYPCVMVGKRRRFPKSRILAMLAAG